MNEKDVFRGQVDHTYSTDSAIQIRLDAQKVLNNLRTALTGKDYYADMNGKLVIDDIGEPLANRLGIQRLMMRMANIVNPQTVQGNFKYDDYNIYLSRLHKNLAIEVMLNRKSWGIDRYDYRVIINTFMDLVEPFISRLIDDRERGSYKTTLRTVESSSSNTIQKGKNLAF